MKKSLVLFLALLLVFSIVGCGGAQTAGTGGAAQSPAAATQASAEQATDKLVVYSPNSEGLINATIPLFEQKYGVKVELIQAGTGELIKRLQSEAADPYCDVMFGGAHSQFVANKDLFQDYVSPNDKNVEEAYQNKSGYTTSYVLDGSVIIVNKNLIGDIPVTGYADLLNPALKGKISSADPGSSSSAFAQLTDMLLAMGGYENDAAWDYVKQLYTNINGKITAGSSEVYKGVADGEMVVGLSYEDPCAQLVRDGAPVEIVYPKEGTVFLPATSGIIKGAKNVVNARKFIDFILSEEVQDIYGTTLTNRPVLKGVKTADYMKPLDQIFTIIEDMDYVNANKDAIVTKYKDIFASIQ